MFGLELAYLRILERCFRSLKTLASACAGDRAFGDTLVTGFASAR